VAGDTCPASSPHISLYFKTKVSLGRDSAAVEQPLRSPETSSKHGHESRVEMAVVSELALVQKEPGV